uniref:Dystrophin n=1 Tax=Macrostomum lignano TaxID=282301 RepID=A0A1I8GQR0_9PLAT
MRERLDRLRQARLRLAERKRQQQQQQPKLPPKPPPHRRPDAPPTPPVRQSSRERVVGGGTAQPPISMEAIGRLDKSEARLRHWEVSLPLTPLREDSLATSSSGVAVDEENEDAGADAADEMAELTEEERRLAGQLKDFDSECELATAELQLLAAHHQHQQPVCNRAASLLHRWTQLAQQRATPLRQDLRRRQHSRRSRRSQSQALQVRVKSLVDWLATAEAALRQQQLLLGGDAESVRSEQTPELERLASELRSRRPELDSVLADAEQQQQTGFLDNRLNRSIGQLDRRFRELESRIDSHSESLRLALHGLAALEDTAAQAESAAAAAQREVAAWSSVDSLTPAQCASEPARLQEFLSGTLEPLTRLSASLERQSQQLSEARVVLNHDLASRLNNIRQQVMSMRSAIEHRCGLLANLREQQQQQQQQQHNNSKDSSVHSVQQQQQQQHQQTAHPAVSNSVRPPWQRMLHPNGSQLPYYRNADTRETSWDHPIMAELMQSLTELNYIRYAAYRTAAKLRRLQRALYLDLVSLGSAAEVFRDHGIGTAAAGDRLIDVSQMTSCLAGLFARCRTRGGGGGSSGSSADAGLQAQTIDLSLNWLLNVYDHVRSGRLRVLSFKVGLVLLCAAGLEDKYRYLFSAVVDERGALDQRRLGLLLHDCMQVPRHLGEAASFGGSNIEPSVRSCFDKASGQAPTGLSRADSRRYRRMPRDLHRQLANELRAIVDNDFDAESQSSGIRLSHFLAWLRLEPQSIVWLPVLHRLTCSEHSLHQARCSSCKAMPMRGLRYKCLKCFNLNLCQQCFFSGRSARHHKVTHPMQEYVRPPGSGDGIRSLSRTLRNKLRIGGGSGGHGGGGGFSGDLGDGGGGGATGGGGSRGGSPAKLGYLPVQTVREGQAIESPAGSPAHTSSRDMHNRVEAYASRLAEVEQQQQQRQD